MFEQDSMIFPPSSAIFNQYQADGSITPFTLTDTFYDLGLDSIYDRGDIITHSFPGNHLQFSMADVEEFVLPVLLS